MGISIDYGLTAKFLRTLYTLEEPAGILRHKRRPVSMFEDGKQQMASRKCRDWNAHYAGKEVNTNSSYYKQTCITISDGCRLRVQVHNIIECMRTGKWPTMEIDHKDGNERNNSKGNLRLATYSQQAINRKKREDNRSGITGVYKHGSTHWRAQINIEGKRIRLYFGTNFDDAVAARKAGELKYHRKFRRKMELPG